MACKEIYDFAAVKRAPSIPGDLVLHLWTNKGRLGFKLTFRIFPRPVRHSYKLCAWEGRFAAATHYLTDAYIFR